MVVAVGVGKNKKILEAVADVDFDVVTVESEDELVELLMTDNVDAAVRGSLSASLIMSKLKQIYPELYRASYIEFNTKKFLLAPVGIDEGETVAQKLQIAVLASKFLEMEGVKPHVAVLSSGRPNDRGRNKRVDESLDAGDELTALIKEKSIDVKNYYALLEDAVKSDANIIIAADGIVGNTIFRTLVLVAGAKSYGAVALGMKEIYIDTSRSQDNKGYKRALTLADRLTKITDKK
ncbi:MAG: methanogenesis marker protein Mmp4/MtxX [Methanobacterium sp. ERen5]|nr:MAG: methanogenesis marker protein Mmp4/MtxX [Methanobacterium sp. ERen5]